MKAKLLTAVIAGLLVAGCGGDNDDDDAVAAIPGSTSDAGGAGSGTGTTGTSGGDATPISSGGVQYLNETAQTSQSQAQQAQTVAQKASNPIVLNLAQQITNEVNVINQQITQISQTSNVTINNTINNQQQTQINTISSLSGAELDRTYVAGVVDAWKNLLAATLLEARQGADVKVRQTASANILVIEQRLVAAEEILATLEPTAYLVDTYETGLLEIQLGQLALQKSTNAQVSQFAQRMIDDHTQVNASVAALAQQKSTTLPSALSAEQQAIVDVISSFSDADFDRAYMDRNVLTHAEAVHKTSVVSQSSTDAEIRALAAETLPQLQAHLQLAQSIETSVQASQYYQLSQSLTTELQIAQFALARTGNAQINALAQQIVSQNQAAYAELVQLAQQRNETIPLAIQAQHVPAVLQLLRATGADLDARLLALLRTQTNQSLQLAQSAQDGGDSGMGNFIQARISALQSISGQPGSGSGTGTTNDTGNAGTDTIGTTDTTGTTATGTTETTGSTGADTTGTTGTIGAGTTTDTGTTDTGATGTGTTTTTSVGTVATS